MKQKLYFVLAALCLLAAAAACGNGAEPAPGPEASVPEAPAEPAAPEETEPELPVSAPGPEDVEAAAPESPAPEQDPSLSQRERDWIEDIEYLRTEYKTRHMDPFYLCPEEEFDWKLDRLKAKVGELSDVDIYCELRAVIAGMGDNHTFLYPSEALSEQMNNRVLPIITQYFGDRLYLSGYLEGYEQFAPYLLKEIVAVNGIDVAYLERKASDIDNPFNEWSSKEHTPFYDTVFLDWAGCGYTNGYTLQILNENNEVQTVEAPIITREEGRESTVIRPENWDHLFFNWNENQAEYIEGENGGCVYMSYIELDSVMEIIMLFDQTEDLIEAHPECGKLVLDLRFNSGGNGNRVPQIQTCAEQLSRLPVGQTYVITGGYSASGAIACMAIFQDVLDAVVIGEPTGQFASFFHAMIPSGQFVLPHSQCQGRISEYWYETEAAVDAYYDENGRLYPWESTILPDVYVYQDIEDIRQGKDSVIEWVLAQ